MKYTAPRFTLPASSGTDQETWDLATLGKREFIKKYDITSKIYQRVSAGEGSVAAIVSTYYRKA